MAKLDGKIALITGGTTGIGFATALLFQQEGATVVTTGSSQTSVDAAKPGLPGIEVLVSDAGDVAATKALVDHVQARHGRIDLLVINAGVAGFKPIAEIDEAFYDRQFNINVKGPFFLLKHAIPVMPDGASVVLVSSIAGVAGGLPGGMVYGATKAALRNFGRTFSQELMKRRIRVNTVSPGPTSTPLVDKDFTSEQKDAFLTNSKTRVPMGRLGEPEEVAKAILFMAVDATFTTAAELFVDGGIVSL